MNLAPYIEHTILRPDCTSDDIKKCIAEALEHKFLGICVPPYYVSDAFRLLENTTTKIITVVGFSMGYSAVAAKIEEIKRAIDEGVTEIDAVINLCAVKDKDWSFVQNEIESLTTATRIRGKALKLIIETGILSKEEMATICQYCVQAGTDFVKTSTGYNGQGASVEAVKWLRSNLPPSIKVKASGGIHTRAFAEQLVEAGAVRLGCSKSIQIIQEP